VLDTRLMQLTRDGTPVELTPQEYKLVAYLAFHRGRVVSQLTLSEHIYQQEYERSSNSIEVLVGRLRRRIGADVVKTRRGFGYYIEADA
jgi:DNA-binding response OmpR family regulator